ncbi:MAG: S41 family peptidase [Bacteroidia bacterium]
MKKIKLLIIVIATSAASVLTFSFTEDYFEVSKNLDIFATLFRELNIYYVDETKPGELMKTGIDAMLESLDPYTNYIPESDIEDYRFMTTGQYGGIGASVREMGDKVIITEPYEGTPAQKAGLKAGDILLEVNGNKIEGKNSDDISKLLKGQPGTPVKLVLQRPGELKNIELNMVREEIKVKDVPYSGMLNGEIGYIKLTGFTKDAAKEVKEAFLKLKTENNCKSLVFDLRGNPGGLLHQAVDIVNLFVDKGQDVAITKGKIKEWEQTLKAVNNPVDVNTPIVVLVDRNSASAAEVVSGALQDLDRAVILGQRTYGKGLVQQTRQLTYNSQFKVTVAKYYIPSGRCIQALDYSHRTDDGSVEKVPDSLITAFKTKNGRIVYDGAGILPDINTEPEAYSNISAALLNKNHIFEFATLYAIRHPKLEVSARDFKLSEREYEDFMTYLEGKDYTYSTRSEKDLEELKKSASEEKYFEDISKQYEALKSQMKENKKDDLIKFKDEIKELIEDEIVSRYYFQSGRLEASIKYDQEINEAIKLLSAQDKVKAILTTIEKPTKRFNPNKKF